LSFSISRQISDTIQSTMATNDSTRTGFRISNGPVAGPSHEDASDFARAHLGSPLLFAMPRDPRTLFVYWNIDWSTAFGGEEPKNRQVYLRVMTDKEEGESESIIEPLLGSFYAAVAKPRGNYRVNLGYYTLADEWRSIAFSDAVTMPPDSVSENTVVDVATVPFHLSFQKMIDSFCESNGDPLATVLSRIQERALTSDDVDLPAEEREVLLAMNLSVNALRQGRKSFSDQPNKSVLRKRAEAILGFGATSPTGGFSSSSWS
jgi:hypothetical protein